MSGAVYGVYRFTLEPDGEGGRGTRLQLSHHAFGDTSKAQQGDYDRGWREMLTLLKQVAEWA
jgi:uncharacterized protein YndB with AHSA1/START domain